MQNGQQEMVVSGGSLHAKCCGGLLGTKLICWKPRVLRLYIGGRNMENTGGVATRELCTPSTQNPSFQGNPSGQPGLRLRYCRNPTSIYIGMSFTGKQEGL